MKTLVFLFFTIPVISFGQEVRWNFEDNDLTQWYQNIPGRWEIISDRAISGSFSLHHAYDNDKAGTDWICFFHKPLNLSEAQTVWQFSIKYNYKPSANNHWEVMLASSNLPSDDGMMDYALVLGVNYRGSDDEIHLWKQKGEKAESIISTGFNWEDKIKPGLPVFFKITRSALGLIILEIDTCRGCYFKIGETMEPEITQSQSFLICYIYSPSYDRGLWVDDLFIQGKFDDSNPSPKVENIHILSSTKILAEFNQIVKIEKDGNFCVKDVECGNAVNKIGRYLKVDLPFGLHPGDNYTLQMPKILDMYNHSISEDDQAPSFYYPSTYDVVIDEIMADPSPPVMLPETEYVEFLNTTNKKISLYDWQIMVNNKLGKLPNRSISSGDYLILCDENAVAEFENLKINTLGIKDFPVLKNDGTNITLIDPSGKMIHSVNYSDSWYDSESKKSGGWSLEMINPADPCVGKENWKECIDYRGGTPGGINSVHSGNTLNKPPKLLRAAITDSGSLMLYFSEPMDSLTLAMKGSYCVDHEIGMPIIIQPAWPIADRVELFFLKKFEKKLEYKIVLSGDPSDCSGLPIGTKGTVFFSVPESADSGDIVINEIMFDPKLNFREYLEFYNRSSKTIDLKGFQIITGDLEKKGKAITNDYFQLPPNSYLVLSKDNSGINSEDEFVNSEWVMKMSDMPTLSDEGTSVFLLDKNGKNIDGVTYSPSFHHPLLSNTKGVSLERISPDISGQEAVNWQSASSDAGYQTPAARNSQYELTKNGNSITIDPQTITPNSDGNDDELSICYQMDEPGYMARIYIFDKNGKRIFSLANGSILGTTGCYNFKGYNDAGSVLKTGYYIVYFEAYTATSKRFMAKKTFVIAQ